MPYLSDKTIEALRIEDYGLNKVCDWKLKFVLSPRTCFLTGKRLWLEYVYFGTRLLVGPGEPIVDEYYIDKTEFIIWQLKR